MSVSMKYMGWWGGGRRKTLGHSVAVSWEIKGGSEPGGSLVLSLLSWVPLNPSLSLLRERPREGLSEWKASSECLQG